MLSTTRMDLFCWSHAFAGDDDGNKEDDGNKADNVKDSNEKKNQKGDEPVAEPEGEEAQYWRKLAERTVMSFVELIAEPETEQKLKEILDKVSLRDTFGCSGSQYVGILIDLKLAGEPITAPHLRTTPLNKKRLTKVLGATLRARSKASDDAAGGDEAIGMVDGDCIMFLDGGKAGVQTRMQGVIRSLAGKCQRKAVTVAFSEQSLVARRSRVRGVATLDQTETLSIVTDRTFTVPDKNRQYYQGSNRGSLLAWVALPKWESDATWTASFEAKKEIYGKSRTAVGGQSVEKDDADDDEEEMVASDALVPMSIDSSGNLFIPKVRNNENLEPVAYWGMPVQFYQELLSSYCMVGFYDMCAGGFFKQ